MAMTLHSQIRQRSARLARDRRRIGCHCRRFTAGLREACATPRVLAGGMAAGFVYGMLRPPRTGDGGRRWRRLLQMVPSALSLTMSLARIDDRIVDIDPEDPDRL